MEASNMNNSKGVVTVSKTNETAISRANKL